MSSPHWYIFLTCSVSLGTIVFCLFLVTSSPVYTDNCFKVSLLFCLLICALSLSVYLQLSDPTSPSEPVERESLSNVSTTFVITDISESGLFALYVEVSLTSPDLTEIQRAMMSGVAADLYGHSSTALRHPQPRPVLLCLTGDIGWLYAHLKVNIKTWCLVPGAAFYSTILPGTTSPSWSEFSFMSVSTSSAATSS